MLTVTETTVKNILICAEQGFLRNKLGARPVCSHSLQPYSGCTYGNALCGVGCYVRGNYYVTKGREWGGFLDVRTNAADSYATNYDKERRWAERERGEFTVFCSSSTDPFVPQEQQYGVTRSILEAMVERPPDVLILQTHSHLVSLGA